MSNILFERRDQRLFVGPVCVYPYPTHMHTAMEVVYLYQGNLNLTVEDQVYSIKPGEMLCIFPGLIHSYEHAEDNTEGLCVALIPELVPEYSTILNTTVPENPLLKVDLCRQELRETLDHLVRLSGGEEQLLTVAYVRVLLAVLFSELNLIPVQESNQTDLLHDVHRYISEHFAENLSLEKVAKEMGVSRSHLSHLFSRRLHVNFRQLINERRIECACDLLQYPELSVKEIAYRSGFENTRTFHRVFQEKYGMTPVEYRERSKNGWMEA